MKNLFSVLAIALFSFLTCCQQPDANLIASDGTWQLVGIYYTNEYAQSHGIPYHNESEYRQQGNCLHTTLVINRSTYDAQVTEYCNGRTLTYPPNFYLLPFVAYGNSSTEQVKLYFASDGSTVQYSRFYNSYPNYTNVYNLTFYPPQNGTVGGLGTMMFWGFNGGSYQWEKVCNSGGCI